MEKDIEYLNWFEGGGSFIKKTQRGIELYEVPLYGGYPQFIKLCKDEKEAREIASNLT
jgi:hypothetical protein